MSRRTATIRVLCRSEMVDQTAKLLAWAVGHPVATVQSEAVDDSRWLLVLTDLAYDGDSETILEHLGLDMIAKISGVQYWDVVPSDADTWAMAAIVENENDQAVALRSMEEQLTAALVSLPTPIALMPRGNGRYLWKWMEATGEAPSFIAALRAALRHVTYSYLAIQAEARSEEEIGASRQPSDRDLEFSLKQVLYSLPLPIAIEEEGSGACRWRWCDSAGEAEGFVLAVVEALTPLMNAYVTARRELLSSSGDPLDL